MDSREREATMEAPAAGLEDMVGLGREVLRSSGGMDVDGALMVAVDGRRCRRCRRRSSFAGLKCSSSESK
jgi:hypothetical protein